MPKNYQWNNLSEDDLGELGVLFENRRQPSSFKIETDVKPGETIVGDVYQGLPGEYVITRLTPTVKEQADGTTIVSMFVDSIRVSVTGEMSVIASRNEEIGPKTKLMTGQMTLQGLYGTTIQAKASDDRESIHVKAEGTFLEGLVR